MTPSQYFIDRFSPHALEDIAKKLKIFGVATFKALSTHEELQAFASQIGKIVYHGDADNLGVMTIKPDESKVDESTGVGGAFTRKALPLHTDGKGVTQCTLSDGSVRNGPADLFILNAVFVEDPDHAVPVFCDGKLLYERIKSIHPDKFDFLSSDQAILKYTTQPGYEYSGPLFQLINEKVTLRFNIDESHHWPQEFLDVFLQTANEMSFQIPLRSGEAYLIDNRRMLHGRTEVGERANREAWHILIYTDPQSSIGKLFPVYSL